MSAQHPHRPRFFLNAVFLDNPHTWRVGKGWAGGKKRNGGPLVWAGSAYAIPARVQQQGPTPVPFAAPLQALGGHLTASSAGTPCRRPAPYNPTTPGGCFEALNNGPPLFLPGFPQPGGPPRLRTYLVNVGLGSDRRGVVNVGARKTRSLWAGHEPCTITERTTSFPLPTPTNMADPSPGQTSLARVAVDTGGNAGPPRPRPGADDRGARPRAGPPPRRW